MQFQFSVCMYGTCGRIDNKADFDFLCLTEFPVSMECPDYLLHLLKFDVCI